MSYRVIYPSIITLHRDFDCFLEAENFAHKRRSALSCLSTVKLKEGSFSQRNVSWP